MHAVLGINIRMVKLSESLVLARSRATDLENVRKLNCCVNKIESLEDFGFCSNLEELYIRKNNINSLAEICHLKPLPKLRILWLADNPCANQENYRLTVLKHLPNLQKLDNILVNEQEVNDAIEQGLDLESPASGDSKNLQISKGSAEEGRENTESPAEAAASNGVSEKDESSDTVADLPPVSASVSILEGRRGEKDDRNSNPVSMSWEETNKIRAQLGLKPLAVEKVTAMKPRSSYSAKSRNANVLQAVLHLVKELDGDSLEVVADAVRNRLDSL